MAPAGRGIEACANYLGPRGEFNYGLRVFSLTRQEQALILCVVLSLAGGAIIKQCRRAYLEQHTGPGVTPPPALPSSR